jgi:hypothetical protein
MSLFQRTPLALALSAGLTTLAHAGINVPTSQTCDTARAPTAYTAKAAGSTATLAFLVGPSKMTPCYIQTDVGSSEPSLAIRKDGTLIYAPIHFP